MPHYDGGGAGDSKDRFYYMDVSMLWTMLQEHDNAPHQKALKGWRQSYELVLMHRTQVETYKEKLITAWPPGRSKASRAYVERLDHLIESLTETYEAAISNYTAYSTAIAAVDDAKWRLESIKREHDANADALTKYAEEMRDRPRPYGKAAAAMPPPPSPVADGRQEQLRLQAAGLMAGLSAELATAQMSLTAPKPYIPINRMDNSSDSFETGGSGGLPPVMPSASGPGTGSARSSKSPPLNSDARNIAPTPNNGKNGQRPPAQRPPEGPILGGTKQPVNPPPSTTPTTPTPLSPTPSFGDSPNITPTQGSPSGTLPRNLSPNGSPVGGMPFGTAPSATGARGGSPLHGGVIGATPPMGGSPSGRAGQLSSGSRGTQRVNPLGGMIGQGAVAPSGRRLSPRDEQEARSQRWDPDNPWETENGIDPILLPHPEQRIDPGPTIGGR
jgi:hypothetical protein